MAEGSSVVELCTWADAELDAATSAKFFLDDDGAGARGAVSSFSWPEAARTPSRLFDQSAVQVLCETYKVPSEYICLCLDRRWVVCQTPPEGSIFVYADALEAGMRIPLHDFYVELLRHYGLAPSQVTPDAWRILAAFVMLSQDAGVEPSLPAFRAFFSICTHDDGGGGGAVGWHHFRPRPGGRCLFKGMVPRSPDPQWKSRFFLLRSPSTRPWPFPVKWGKPSRAAVRMPVVTADTDMVMKKLLDTAESLFSRLRVGAAGLAAGPPQPPKLPPPPTQPPPSPPQPPQEPTKKRKSLSETHTRGRGLVDCIGEAFELAEKSMAEHDEKGKELEATRREVAELKEALSAANAQHAAEVRRLEDEQLKAAERAAAAEHHKAMAELDEKGKELEVCRGEVAQLKEALSAANAQHAAEVRRLEDEHRKAAERAAEHHKAEMARLQDEHAAAVARLEEDHATSVDRLMEERAADVARVKDAADKEVQDIKKKIVLRLFPTMDVSSLLERSKLKRDLAAATGTPKGAERRS